MDHYCPLSHFKVDGKVWFFISAGFRFQPWLLFECFPHHSPLRRFVSFASYHLNDLNARKDWTVEGLPCYYLQSINQIMKLNFHPKLFWSSDEPSIYNQIKKLHFHSKLFIRSNVTFPLVNQCTAVELVLSRLIQSLYDLQVCTSGVDAQLYPI